jgi:hypothetical protein
MAAAGRDPMTMKGRETAMDTQHIDAVMREIRERHRLADGTIDKKPAKAEATARLKEFSQDEILHWFVSNTLRESCEPGVFEATGTLNLPGLNGTPEYEPHRTCQIDEKMYLWETMTVAQHATVAQRIWELAAVAHHAMWAAAETQKGRGPKELTWGACVAESGIFTPFDEAELARRRAKAEAAEEAEESEFASL